MFSTMDRSMLGISTLAMPQRGAESLMQLMNKESKSSEELHIILSKLTTVTYFNQFVEQYLSGSKNDQLMKLCSHLKMEKFVGGDVVIKEGDVSNNKLYIIFFGTCLMIRKRPMESLQDQTPKRPQIDEVQFPQSVEIYKSPAKIGMFAKKLTNQLFLLQADKQITAQQKQALSDLYGQPFKQLKKGEGFGEKALLQNQNRALTVAASSQELYLVILLKEDFQMIQKYIERELKEKQELVFQIFRNVINEYSSARIETMVYSFETIEYDKNTVLTVEEEKGSVFFIIQSGEVTLSKKETIIDNSGLQNRNRQIPICLCLIGQGNLLGEEIIIKKSKIYDYTAIVRSPTAKVMVIDAVQFNAKFPVDCKEQIVQDYRAKVASRQHTFLKVIQNRQNNIFKMITQDKKVDLDAFSQLYSPRTKAQKLIKKHVTNKTSFTTALPQAKAQFSGRIFKSFDQEQIQPISALNLNTNLSPSVGNYCIQQIVNIQNENYAKYPQSIEIFVDIDKISQNQSIEPYDFGKHELEDARQKQFIFEIKNNIVNPLPKYIDRDQQLLTNVIKKRFLKTIRKKCRSRDTLLYTSQSIFKQSVNSSNEDKNHFLLDKVQGQTSLNTQNKYSDKIKTSYRVITQNQSPRFIYHSFRNEANSRKMIPKQNGLVRSTYQHMKKHPTSEDLFQLLE